ncbi:MAG: spore maturation protein [Tyzzerella sp.]|nr:spore maturation protein [Tyzzerella sp.]
MNTNLFVYISDFIVPSVIILIVAYGVLEKVKVYDEFVKGAKKGFSTVIKIMPTLVGLMVAVGILRASGFLEFLSGQIGKVTDYIGFPSQLVPLSIVRLFSASAATGLVLDIFKEYGTDSRIGLIASIMMCCTETVFYTMSVYFMAAKVKKTRYTLTGALLATVAGIVASVWLAGRILL